MKLNNIDTIHVGSMLDEKLIASYRQTQYRIFTEHETIDATIDYYSQSIESLLSASSSDSAAIVTAYNPYSQLRNEEENYLANELLRAVLIKNNHRFLESLNIDPIQVWPAEKSFLVLDLDINTAENIGRKFNQNSIVWIDRSAIAQLILLR